MSYSQIGVSTVSGQSASQYVIPQQSVTHGFEEEIKSLERSVSVLQIDLHSLQIASEDQRKKDTELANKRRMRLVVQQEKQLDELLCEIESFHENLCQKMDSSVRELKCPIQQVQGEQEVIRRRVESIQEELASIRPFIEDSTLKLRKEMENIKTIQETSNERHVLKIVESLKSCIQEESKKREEEKKSSEGILKSLMEKIEWKIDKCMNSIRSFEQGITSRKSFVETLKQSTNGTSKKMEHLPEEQDINTKQNTAFPEHNIQEKEPLKREGKNGTYGKDRKPRSIRARSKSLSNTMYTD